MDLASIHLPRPVQFGGGIAVSDYLTAVEYELVYEPESGVVMARHRRTNRVRLLSAHGAYMEPAEAPIKPREQEPAAKDGRGSAPRRPR